MVVMGAGGRDWAWWGVNGSQVGSETFSVVVGGAGGRD